MTLASLLSPDRVIPDLEATDHWPTIVELVEHLVEGNHFPEHAKDDLLVALRNREDQRSTGIGGGIAIPHCFSDAIDEVVTIFGRSEAGVDFSAVDRALVHYIVLFIVPAQQHGTHLKTLAAIAKILNSAEVRNQLSEAENSAEIMEVLGSPAAAAGD
ncbi:MAG: PTS sugar transporter subunit IIA [Verrucomicrobiales bacterium]|nr:PTS sugar transporter subunit IIA [Verrucomicrobiales bacterium]